jgi:hypothetical protein
MLNVLDGMGAFLFRRSFILANPIGKACLAHICLGGLPIKPAGSADDLPIGRKTPILSVPGNRLKR